MQELRNQSNSGRQGEPTRTGKVFQSWVEKYRKRHPERMQSARPFPLELQDQWWIRAAQETGDTQLLDAINNVRANKDLPKVKING